MSAFLLGVGFRADMGTCVRKLVLLKLIDACDDDGTRIFPAIATIARAAQCSTRQVQRELQSFREIGLIRLVKEGGKGPRSTNEYEMDLDMLHRLGRDGWEAVVGAKGDTESPLQGEDKGDSGDTVRVTQETDKGDSRSHTTPPEPSIDPSSERERGRDAEDRKSVEKSFERAWQSWPTSVSDSRPAAWRAWLGLTPQEREVAATEIPRWLEANRAAGRRHVPAFGVYLAEKRWQNLPPPPVEPPKPVMAPPFGPVFAARRMRDLVTGPKRATPLKDWELKAIEAGTLDRERTEKGNRQRGGWPEVNRLHELAAAGRGFTCFDQIDERLAAMCEFVPVGTETWVAWKVEHELRGWPWLPDPGKVGGAYFPAGGPGGLPRFEAAVSAQCHQVNEAAE